MIPREATDVAPDLYSTLLIQHLHCSKETAKTFPPYTSNERETKLFGSARLVKTLAIGRFNQHFRSPRGRHQLNTAIHDRPWASNDGTPISAVYKNNHPHLMFRVKGPEIHWLSALKFRLFSSRARNMKQGSTEGSQGVCPLEWYGLLGEQKTKEKEVIKHFRRQTLHLKKSTTKNNCFD